MSWENQRSDDMVMWHETIARYTVTELYWRGWKLGDHGECNKFKFGEWDMPWQNKRNNVEWRMRA